jgi:hypothetical protein
VVYHVDACRDNKLGDHSDPHAKARLPLTLQLRLNNNLGHSWADRLEAVPSPALLRNCDVRRRVYESVWVCLSSHRCWMRDVILPKRPSLKGDGAIAGLLPQPGLGAPHR